MQVNLSSRGLRLGAAVCAVAMSLTLIGCGTTLNDGVTGSVDTGPPGATAGLGVQPPPVTKEQRDGAPRTSAKLLRGVSALESTGTPGNDGYRIGPQDVLEISVFQAPDLAKAVQVAESGTINLPLVGDVRAGGVTARELEQDLKAKYGARYLQNPQVTVFVREYNSQRVTVEGAVERPGVYPYRGRVSLLQLIATAGGLKDVADGSEVLVFRTATGKREAARFNIDDVKTGTASDPPIMQGDVVIVGVSSAKKFYNDVLKALPMVGAFGLLL